MKKLKQVKVEAPDANAGGHADKHGATGPAKRPQPLPEEALGGGDICSPVRESPTDDDIPLE